MSKYPALAQGLGNIPDSLYPQDSWLIKARKELAEAERIAAPSPCGVEGHTEATWLEKGQPYVYGTWISHCLLCESARQLAEKDKVIAELCRVLEEWKRWHTEKFPNRYATENAWSILQDHVIAALAKGNAAVEG